MQIRTLVLEKYGTMYQNYSIKLYVKTVKKNKSEKQNITTPFLLAFV